MDHSIGTQYSANPPVTIDVPMTDMTSGLMGHSQLTTIDQSELSSQLGLSLGGGTILPPAQSPEDRLSTTPSPTSSLHEDGVEDFRRVRHSLPKSNLPSYSGIKLLAYRAYSVLFAPALPSPLLFSGYGVLPLNLQFIMLFPIPILIGPHILY